ncbi:Uncharacterised protein r2_g1350 [Pycnogonum litorale]
MNCNVVQEDSLCIEEPEFELVLLPENTTSSSSSNVRRYSSQSAKGKSVPLTTIKDFVETTIVIKKDENHELGISVVGGIDTYLESLCVSNVYPDGAAAEDGRLRRGDLLLSVNDWSLRNITFLEGVTALREATSPVRLTVLRENPFKLFSSKEDPSKFITVELRKNNITDRIGISIMELKGSRGVCITYIEPGSIAATQSRLILQGDQILEINGKSIKGQNQKQIAEHLKNIDGAIVLLLGRVPSIRKTIQEWSTNKPPVANRPRTSTWSYSVAERDALRSQRSSLPTNKGSPYRTFSMSETPSQSTESFEDRVSIRSEEDMRQRLGSASRGTRLSVVAEDTNVVATVSDDVLKSSVTNNNTHVVADVQINSSEIHDHAYATNKLEKHNNGIKNSVIQEIINSSAKDGRLPDIHISQH